MNVGWIARIAWYGCLIGLVGCRSAPPEEPRSQPYYWQQYRGVNVGCDIGEQDVEELAQSGANLMRLSMPVCAFMELDSPYAYRPEAFATLDSVLNWGERYGVNVLIDPHRYPGTEHPWTMLGSDPFWQDFKWHELVINFWDSLASHCASRGQVVAGYDLLNEPQVNLKMQKDTPEDINLLYAKLTTAIRQKDALHTIVYALPRVYDAEQDTLYSYHQGITELDIPADDNICLESHTYMPMAFSHQNIWEEGAYVAYPTTVEGVTWNAAHLEQVQSDLIDFSKKHPDVPILIGEFSSPRWTGQDGLHYLTDVIELAEQHGWSWAYHAYRESHVWDPEMSITNRGDSVRRANAPRWELLKSYFARNE